MNKAKWRNVVRRPGWRRRKTEAAEGQLCDSQYHKQRARELYQLQNSDLRLYITDDGDGDWGVGQKGAT